MSSIGSATDAALRDLQPTSEASVLVAKKALDQQKAEGAQMVALIRDATTPTEPGLGARLDVYA